MHSNILKEFVENVSVVNDVAERGVKLINDYINMCKSESQRDALTQVVEQHRSMFPNYDKQMLETC